MNAIMSNKRKFIGLFSGVTICLIMLLSCGGSDSGSELADPYLYQTPTETNDGLNTASLEDVNLDETKIAAGVKSILSGTYNDVLSLLVVKDGKLVLEEYFEGYDRNTLCKVWSVTKSITSTLIGIAIDRGDIDSVDEFVFDYFPEYSAYENDTKSQIKIAHLLSLSSGLSWKLAEPPYDWDVIQTESDPIRYILSKPAVATPGTVFNYSEGDVILLGEIINKVSSLNMKEYLSQYLFSPMGIQSFDLETIGSSSVYSASQGLWLRPRDMAKLGLLILQKGVWNETQIVSEEWVSEATKEQIDTSIIRDVYGYGYNWWLESWKANSQSYDSCEALGYKGNMIIIFPDLQMVVVLTGDDSVSEMNNYADLNIVPKYILTAVLE